MISYKADESDGGFSYKYAHPSTFKIALDNFLSSISSVNNNWFVAISSHNKITMDFKLKLDGPLNQSGQKFEKKNVSSVKKLSLKKLIKMVRAIDIYQRCFTQIKSI